MSDSPGHLDLDALADVLAGELDDPHLRSCAACSARLDDLAEADASVTAALRSLPAPPLPEGLSARLTGALQEERRRGLAPVRPLRRRPPTWLPAVAASAVLVLAGAAGWSLLDLSGAGSQDADTTASAGAGGGGEDTDTAVPDTAAPQAAVPGAAAPEAAAPDTAAGLAAPPRAASATDWADEASRPAALSRLLPDAADPSAGAAAAVPSGDGLDRLRDPAAFAACVGGLPSDTGTDVLAVDYASYAGAPAVAVVQADGPALVRVTVVGSGCSAADPDLLLRTVLPRP